MAISVEVLLMTRARTWPIRSIRELLWTFTDRARSVRLHEPILQYELLSESYTYMLN